MMKIFKFFGLNETVSKSSALQIRLQELLPEFGEQEAVLVASIAGLLARVAYCDFEIDTNEQDVFKEELKKLIFLSTQQVDTITEIALNHASELGGIEDHFLCAPLLELYNKEQRYQLLISLFKIARSDGKYESIEENELRKIASGLRLPGQYFVAARHASLP
jgi:uncharacterized tellurite resistance protein B-like protein